MDGLYEVVLKIEIFFNFVCRVLRFMPKRGHSQGLSRIELYKRCSKRAQNLIFVNNVIFSYH